MIIIIIKIATIKKQFFVINTCILSFEQNKKLPPDVETDTGEVSDDEEEPEETIPISNGDFKLERQNSKHGSLKRQIVKVGGEWIWNTNRKFLSGLTKVNF